LHFSSSLSLSESMDRGRRLFHTKITHRLRGNLWDQSGTASVHEKAGLGLLKASDLLLKDSNGAPYLEYSTCTGAGVVGISLKLGMGRRGGAAESLVQQPQDEDRTAMTLTEMARKKRIMVGLV
jgi:hypothetical protein